jgi:tRNA (mo5U34)-methyltransferase
VNYDDLIRNWKLDPDLAAWAEVLPEQIQQGLDPQRYGDLARWQQALASLPPLDVTERILTESAVGVRGPVANPAMIATLKHALEGLHPWRKGPFNVFGVEIDTEWRSDWKWDRVLPHLTPLQDKRVLDIGCGSGYHCWRMLGEGAREVIGIDPTPLFVLQFWALQQYMQQPNITVLPLGVEDIPPRIQAFDTVFSMGILYHRRSPFEHLSQLKDCLVPGGQLVLETLVVDGDKNTVFVPPGRYARMGNVWCLPSTVALEGWLAKVGFRNPRTVDVNQTTVQEQRRTEWMQFHSLEQFLNPHDHNKTVEGHPAPVRAVLLAEA